MHALVRLCIKQHTKFAVHSFTVYKDMIGGIIYKESHNPGQAH